MKGLKSLMAAMMLLLPVMTVHADAGRFVSGIEYIEIIPKQHTKAPKGKIEVVEMFWYGCGHCYRLEPKLNKWLKSKPENVHFVRMPSTANPKWAKHAQMYYTLQALGKVEETHAAIFHHIHEKKKHLHTVDEMAAFFVKFGISREKFTKTYKSLGVLSRVAHAKGMGQRYGIRSVPTMIVNGQYKTTETNAGSKQTMFEVIEALVKKESAKAK